MQCLQPHTTIAQTWLKGHRDGLPWKTPITACTTNIRHIKKGKQVKVSIPPYKGKIQDIYFLHTYHCRACNQHNMCICNNKTNIYHTNKLCKSLWKFGKAETVSITSTYHHKGLVSEASMIHMAHYNEQ
jgi:hypothetical protein